MGFEKTRRPPLDPSSLAVVDIQSTTAAITQNPLGVTSLATTTTGAPLLVTLNPPTQAGMIKKFAVASIASTTGAPFHINSASSDTVFNQAGDDMIALSSDEASIELTAESSSRWLITGGNGFTLSTST